MAQEKTIRNSRQRTLVFDALKASHEHPSAEEIYLAVKEQMPDISLGTVYRNLNLLEQMRMVNRIHTGVSGDRFDAVVSEHPHIICTKCGRVADIACCIDEETAQLREKLQKSAAQIEALQIMAWGVCDHCK